MKRQQQTARKSAGTKQPAEKPRPATEDRKTGGFQPHNAEKEALGPNTRR